MTISTTSSQSTFLGNDSTTVFTYSFVCDAASEFQAFYNDGTTTVLLSPSQYTLNLNAPATNSLHNVGGTVTYPTAGPAISSGTSLTVRRILPLSQTSSISNQGDFYPTVVELALDNQCLETQQVSARTGQIRGIWQTGIAYNFGDVVQDGVNGTDTLNYYMCAIANTSGTWSTDLAAGDWSLAIDVVTIEQYAIDAASNAAAAAASAGAASSSASSASASASTAMTEASTATTQAGIATTQAAAAATSASNAATSASSASTSATSSSTNATASAASATSAAASATSAASSATTATTQASNASTSATNAAASALSAASTLTATSTTSNTIGTGSFTFTTQANKNFYPGQFIIAASNANGANYLHGQVTSYSGTTLIMTESDNGGSGAHADWNISASSPQGTSGSGAGTVTSASVATANGFAGTVANPTTTPAITITTSISGVLKGNGTAISQATAGTDYLAPGGNAGTPSAIVLTNATGTAAALNIGGNAATATKTATPRTIAMTGDVTYNSGNFDGSANVTAAGTLATVNSNVGSFTNANVTVNAKGLITAASNGTAAVVQSIRLRNFLQGTTYTPDASVGSFYVFVSGSTGSLHVSGVNPGGTGAAGYSEKYYAAPSGSYTYSIGAGHVGTSAGAGANTTFDTISITGSGGVSNGTGSAGGVASGGDFNANGGAGGNFSNRNGGPGGAAGRAGNGGNGGNGTNLTIAGGGGGTGGNNASANIGGIAAAAVSGSALVLPFGIQYETFQAGTSGVGSAPGNGASGTSTIDMPYMAILGAANAGQGTSLSTASLAGANGTIWIVEILQ